MAINFKIHYWPSLVFIWFWLTCLISYIVLQTQDNAPDFPFISELGAWVPASCIFGQMMNIMGLFSGIVMYLRYKQVDLAIDTNTTSLNKIWNKIGKWLGFTSALGMSIVGNFQGNLDIIRGVFITHLIGAYMAFGVGGIYLLVQVKITFGLRPYYQKFPQFGISKFIQYFRLISIAVFVISNLVVFVFFLILFKEIKGYRWQGLVPGDIGYNSRLVAVIAEWNLAVIYLLNLLTITNELKAITFVENCFKRVV